MKVKPISQVFGGIANKMPDSLPTGPNVLKMKKLPAVDNIAMQKKASKAQLVFLHYKNKDN